MATQSEGTELAAARLRLTRALAYRASHREQGQEVKMKAVKTAIKWLFLVAGGLFAAVVVLAIVLPAPKQVAPPTQPTNSPTVSERAQPVAAAVPPPPIATALPPTPTDEARLIEITAQGEADYDDGANDMMKGASRPKRAKAICSALRHVAVRGWLGTVETLSSNSDGKGVLAVRISRNTVMKTWNNSLSDTGSDTLLDPASSVFAQATALKEDEPVVFSGSFVASETDCIKESSFTIGGSMEEPEFIFRFTDVRPAP